MAVTIIRKKPIPAPISANHVGCPKCHSHHAFYQRDHYDVWLRCLCGYMKVVSTTLETTIIEHIDSDDEVSLPRKDSKLYECLVALLGLGTASTSDIADVINFDKRKSERQNNGYIATQLVVLRYKGLVEVCVGRKGVAGGSVWGLTAAAKKLFKGVGH